MGLSMASVWMLSKESMKGMDIVSVSTDILYAFEQSTRGQLSQKELNEKCQEGLNLLSLLSNAVIAQTKAKTGKSADLFMLKVAESLEKSIAKTPTQVHADIDEAKKELERCKISSKTICLLERVSDVVMNLTSRSVEEISTSLR